MLRRQSKVRRVLKERRRELRGKATEAESVMWPLLRSLREQDMIFRRQHSISHFIADFCCPAEKLVIEIDGKIHDLTTQQAYDTERTEYLMAAGYRVLRFKNKDILDHPKQVIESIVRYIMQNPSPATVGEGQG